MLWFLFLVAVLNMVAGFSLGIVLSGKSSTEEPLADDGIQDNTEFDDFDLSLGLSADPKQPGDVPAVDASPDGPVAETTAETEGTNEPEDLATPGQNSIMDELDAAVSLALGDEPLPENADLVSPPAQEELPKEREAERLRAYRQQLEGFREELVALDEQLRREPAENTVDLKLQLDSIVESGEKNGEACEAVELALRGMIAAETIDQDLGEAVIAAMRQERQEAAETTRGFRKADLRADPAVQAGMILHRTAKLLDSNHQVRDGMSDVIRMALPPEAGEAESDKIDALTGIMSRAALDSSLAEHWKTAPPSARATSLTLVDLDQFGKVNRIYGPALGDRVLRAVAQLIESEMSSHYRVARFAGQRFALLGFDRDLKQALSDTERMRQTIAGLRLEYGESELNVTMSCGVVAALSDDSQRTLYARALEAVQEAKRYGGNRSFIHEGEYPTPVVPPRFELDEKHIAL